MARMNAPFMQTPVTFACQGVRITMPCACAIASSRAFWISVPPGSRRNASRISAIPCSHCPSFSRATARLTRIPTCGHSVRTLPGIFQTHPGDRPLFRVPPRDCSVRWKRPDSDRPYPSRASVRPAAALRRWPAQSAVLPERQLQRIQCGLIFGIQTCGLL